MTKVPCASRVWRKWSATIAFARAVAYEITNLHAVKMAGLFALLQNEEFTNASLLSQRS